MIKPELKVLAVAGDGGCYGEGGNHLLHAAKRNMDLTLLVHNNQVYALTTGQTSPTSMPGFKSKSTPEGSPDVALNPLAVTISAGASFVARGFAGDLPHLSDLITQAIKHKGFSIVDILQPCVSFNNVNTFDWYRQRIYKISEKPANKLAALEKALEFPQSDLDAKIPIGIFWQEEREVFAPETVKVEPKIDKFLAEFL